MVRFILFTTTRGDSRSSNLSRLTQSIQESVGYASGFQVEHFFLLQKEETESGLFDHGVGFRTLVDQLVSLSHARNILLRRFGHLIANEDIVSFPDDDCFYAPEALSHIAAAFAGGGTRMIMAREDHQALHVGDPQLLPKDVVRRSTSNNLFVDGRTVRALGGFDEMIGLGAKLSGGEDTDFAMRAYRRVTAANHCPSAIVHHRKPDVDALRSRYFPGNFAALLSAARHDHRFIMEAARKAAIATVLLARRDLSVAEFVAASKHAVSRTEPFDVPEWAPRESAAQ